MRRRGAFGGILALLMAGCASDGPRVEPRPSAVAPTSPASAATSVGSAPAASASAPRLADALPSVDACDRDEDCGLSYAYLIDGKCCTGTCSPRAVAKSTVVAIETECSSRGYEENRCPARKCVAPDPVVCVQHRCAFAPKTGPISSSSDAVDRAVVAANVALDGAYAKYAAGPGVVAPVHPSRWVDASGATVQGPNASGGYRVSFSSFPPAGFSHEAIVAVGKDGSVTVERAVAAFSPD
ncbi:MAG: hypothetical protein U0414_14455 [Polyangiaceae bacterium]